MKSVFIYVQHLLGIGHLKRIEVIADELARAGFKVCVASGGVELPCFSFAEIELLALPALKTDAQFTALYRHDNRAPAPSFFTHRAERLLHRFNQELFDFLIIEMFPFARRQMRFELIPLLQQAKIAHNPHHKHHNNPHQNKHHRTIICSSIRDIVQLKSADKNQQTCDLIQQYFDWILVHGDKNFIPLTRSFPLAHQFQQKILYTGYITRPYEPANQPIDENANKSTRTVKKITAQKITAKKILVSAGGGAAGKNCYESCLKAAASPQGQKYHWHFLIGNNIGSEFFNEFVRRAPHNAKVEQNRADFRDQLKQCDLSISQAGYNTMMDLIATRTRGILIPFEGVAETEQLMRAQYFAHSKNYMIAREHNLNGHSIVQAIKQMIGHASQIAATDCGNLPAFNLPAMNGGAMTAQLLKTGKPTVSAIP